MKRVAIIGAGPAGLTAAWELTAHGWPVTVLETDPQDVGGIARTVRYKGYAIDVGGHRFFSKSDEIEALWSAILPNDFLQRPRKSRIYFAGNFVDYPLRPLEVCLKLGAVEAIACASSYVKAQVSPVKSPQSYEAWIVNQFGQRLYETFFKTYTEKVWGLGCGDISPDWAAQRIRTFSLGRALLNALPGATRDRRRIATTLVESFRYPRKGPGMMWEACAAKIRERGATLLMGRRVTRIERLGERGYRVEHCAKDGAVLNLEVDHVVCSAALSDAVKALLPTPPAAVLEAASELRYRALLLVVLIARDPGTFDDTWIYVQDADLRMGRLQNYKAWSPEMVPDPEKIALGCEYFCTEGDEDWRRSDEELVARASAELDRMGLLPKDNIVDSCVIRQPKAYPVYDHGYALRIERVMAGLSKDFPGVHLVGRNGMHRYNNQDHSMMTALLTARNILAGRELFNVRQVGQDAEYLEEIPTGADHAWARAGAPNVAGPTESPPSPTGF